MRLAAKILREMKRPFTRTRQLRTVRRDLDALGQEIRGLRREIEMFGLREVNIRAEILALDRVVEVYRGTVERAEQVQKHDRLRLDRLEAALEGIASPT